MHRRLIVALIAVAAALVIDAQAAQAAIVYVCSSNLCRVNSDGTGQTQLTTDGSDAGPAYGEPSLSADGSKLAYAKANRAYVASPDNPAAGTDINFSGNVLLTRLRPDGAVVMAAVEEFYTVYGGLIFVEETMNTDGTGLDRVSFALITGGWDGNQLLRDGHACSDDTPACKAQAICVVTDSARCAQVIAADPTHDLYGPAVSPDGKLVAVSMVPAGGATVTGPIALYDTATGAHVRDLTADATDGDPVWSPDGKSIAFDRGDGGIYVIAADGQPGQERRIATGVQPTWGGGDVAAPSGGGTAGSGTPGSGGAGTPGGSGTKSGSSTKTTSTKKKGCVVPHLKGRTLTQARRALRRAHCRTAHVHRVRHGHRHGRVIRTRPAAGHRTRSGVVSLTVSR